MTKSLLLLAVLPGLCASAHTQDRLAAGSEGPLKLPDASYANHIYVPSDYKPGKRLPLIFFLHGSGGKPTSWPWRTATGGKGYFIVGVAYECMTEGGQGRSGIQLERKQCLAMIAHIDRLRAKVHKDYGIDQRHVIMTGLSMGGWALDAFGICEETKGRYRGFCIMAAGPRQVGLFDPEAAKGLPVLILNGESDANLRVANAGKPLLVNAGAIVTQEIIPGQGHVPAVQTMAKPLGSWLKAIRDEDKRSSPMTAVPWRFGELKGDPGKSSSAAEALGMYFKSQAFLEARAKDKPVLIYLYSTAQKKGKPTRAAKDSSKVTQETFSFPKACATPAAARNFSCFMVDVSGRPRKAHRLLNEAKAPSVILLTADLKLVAQLGKNKLKDNNLMAAMKLLLPEEQQARIDTRIEQTRPILKELQAISKRLRTAQKTLAKLNKQKGKSREAKARRQALVVDQLIADRQECVEKLAK